MLLNPNWSLDFTLIPSCCQADCFPLLPSAGSSRCPPLPVLSARDGSHGCPATGCDARQNQLFCPLHENFRRKVWRFAKNTLPLHRNSEMKRKQNVGSVAQLNRASDYGSEGYGFESHRSHKVNERRIRKMRLFCFLPPHHPAARSRRGHHDWRTGKPANVLRQLKRMPPRGNTGRFASQYRPFQAAKRAVSHSKTARFGKQNDQCQQRTGTQTVTKMPQDTLPFTMVNT